MNNEIRLSVSKTKCFLDCKAKYKYNYIDKLPRKVWSFHTFGKFCHKVLEDFHNEYINGSVEPYNVTMSKAFKNAYNLYKEDMDPQMKKDCWEIINQYLKIIKQNKFGVIACEKNFDFSLEGHENIILNGMIDRIQVDDDNVIHVCDYKTSKNKKYLKDDFFQLLTYAYVISLEDPSIEKVRASYIMLRHNFEYITTEFKPKDILKLKDKYIEYANRILEEKDFEPNPTKLCEYCDFSHVCEASKKVMDPSKVFGEVSW